MAYKSHRASNSIVSTLKGNVKRKSYAGMDAGMDRFVKSHSYCGVFLPRSTTFSFKSGKKRILIEVLIDIV